MKTTRTNDGTKEIKKTEFVKARKREQVEDERKAHRYILASLLGAGLLLTFASLLLLAVRKQSTRKNIACVKPFK